MNNKFNNDDSQVYINDSTFFMECNVTESGLFQFKNKRAINTAGKLLLRDDISKDLKHVLNRMPNKDVQTEFVQWTDSKGVSREIIATSVYRLPGAAAMDTFYGLVGLYIQKNAPCTFLPDKFDDAGNLEMAGHYEFNDDRKLVFTLYELAKFMGIPIDGRERYEKLKESIRLLRHVQFISINALKDNLTGKFTNSRETSYSFLDNYDIPARSADEKGRSDSFVVFNELFFNNMKTNYIRYLSKDMYYALPHGLTRRLYTYIESNKFDKSYLKRSFDVLKYKIPTDFNYPSELKRKLSKPLENLIQYGVIVDYFWGDDTLIDNRPEKCLYIVLKGTRGELIRNLEINAIDSKKKKIGKNKISFELEFPKDILKEMLDLKVSNNVAVELFNKYDKFLLAENLLVIKREMSKGKVKNPAGLFHFMVTSGQIDVAYLNPDIHEFVQSYKKKMLGPVISKNEIELAFYKHANEKLEAFEEKEPDKYRLFCAQIFGKTTDKIDSYIADANKNYSNAKDKKEREKNQELLTKYRAFKKLGMESTYFKDLLISAVRFLADIDLREDFEREYRKKRLSEVEG